MNNIPTEEVVERLEEGMETMQKVETEFWPAVQQLTEKIVENPIPAIGTILVLAAITTTIIKRLKK